MDVVTAIIGSGALSALIAGVFNLVLNRKGRLAKIEASLDAINKQLNRSERDSCRTQLLLLLSDYPEERNEIMTLAGHYFGDLKGNWYMTTIFNDFIEKNGIAKPEWFKGGMNS